MKQKAKIWVIVGGAVALLIITIAANIVRLNSSVHDVVIAVKHPGAPQLVDQQTIKDSILAALPHLTSTHVADVDRERVAAAASAVPYIESATASVSVSGKVVVKALQRRPIARLYYGRSEYYIDDNGVIFPISAMADCDVLVASGNFTEPLRIDSLNSQMTDLFKVALFLDRNNDYGLLIDHIYSEADGDIMLVPKLGDFVIELGDSENLENKFSKLRAFYRNGLPRVGWDTYSRISLKYNEQVVCTKRK